MHQSVFVPIAKCYVPYVQGLMHNYYRVGGLTGSILSIESEVYILHSADPTLALLLMRFTKYDDDDDSCCQKFNELCGFGNWHG
ncbi:hypothetical protein Hanom_Chr04g00315461 [Helianthus anomalus]